MFLIGSLYFVSGSYPHASQFYYAIDRNLTTSASKPVEKRKIHSYKRKTEIVQVKIGSGITAASAGMATTSQSMDLRLDITINPIHEEPIKSSAGDQRDVGSNIHEIRDKLQNTVVEISRTGTISSSSHSSSSARSHDIEEGSSVLNPLLSSSSPTRDSQPFSTNVQSPGSTGSHMETILEDSNLEDDDAEVEDTTHIDVTSPLQLVTASAKAKAKGPKLESRYG
jgi:hypothetical protein